MHKATRFPLDTRFHEIRMKKGETVETFLLHRQETARRLNKPDSDTLGQFLRGLPSLLKSPVMTTFLRKAYARHPAEALLARAPESVPQLIYVCT